MAFAAADTVVFQFQSNNVAYYFFAFLNWIGLVVLLWTLTKIAHLQLKYQTSQEEQSEEEKRV